jgi:hypothetical protein
MKRRYTACSLLLLALTQSCTSGYEPARSPRVAIVMEDGQLTFVKDGEHHHSFWLVGSSALDAVQGDPRAEAEARTARNLEIGGIVFTVGAVGSATGALVSLLSPDEVQHQSTTQALLVSALACDVVALALLLNSIPRVYDAVNIYNDDLDRAAATAPRLALPPASPVLPPASPVLPPAPPAPPVPSSP